MKSRKNTHLFILFFFLLSSPVNELVSQSKTEVYPKPKKFCLRLFGTYVPSAGVQNNLNSSDPIERAAITDLNGGFGFGIEFDYIPGLFNLDLEYYVSTDYLKLDQKDIVYQYFDGVNIVYYRAHDVFKVLPLEIGVKWPLPVGTDAFKIYIGGGAGIYFGDHSRNVDNLTSQTVNSKPGFSLNILAGVDYYFEKNIAANVELKFRDASFDTDSKYNYITNIPNPFSTRLNVDGARVSAGLKYNF